MKIKMCFILTLWLVLSVSFSVVFGISIDGQITIIKSDCYERMAIGEKLSPKQTYKSFDHNTVMKCQMECDEEKERCRAFSFGIGLKGNATCLLSKDPIKETVDLKPIGTVRDTDYDLYTKKLDCQIVLNPSKYHETHGPVKKPANYDKKPSPPEVEEHHNEHDDRNGAYENYPSQSHYYSTVSKPWHESENGGYQYNQPTNQYPLQSPQHSDKNNLHHVQALVSIASGPQSVLHPIHEILVSGDSYGQDKPPSSGNGYGSHDGNMPPFRPESLNHPYGDHRPQQRPSSVQYDTPGEPNSDLRPETPGSGYGDQGSHYDDRWPISSYQDRFNRPYDFGNSFYGRPSNEDRPDPDYGPRPPKIPLADYGSDGQFFIDRRKYESSNQYNSFETESYRYRSRPSEDHPSNYNYYDHYENPNHKYPSRYGSVIPHPNEYNRPNSFNDYLFVRPNSERYDDRRPPKPEKKPVGVNDYRSPGYDRPERPSGGSYRPGNVEDKRPQSESGQTIQNTVTGEGYKQEYGRPSSLLYGKPRPSSSYDHSNTNAKPTKRPLDASFSSSSRPPSTELSNHYGGVNYGNKQYGKPGEYLNTKGEDGNRKIITQSVGHNGEQITSIITELKNACFRRTLAGKRVVRGLVRKLLVCDTVEQCQRECGDERQFTCEGFNYRLDPSGRGKGDCELLDLPILRIDIIREVVPDPDYDYYTRDRNAASGNCRQPPSYYSGSSYGSRYGIRDDYHDDGYRSRPFDRRPADLARPLLRPNDRWDSHYDDVRARPPPIRPQDDRRPRPPTPEDDSRYEYGNRRGDYSFHHSHASHSSHSHSYRYNEHKLDRFDYHQQHEDRRPHNGIHYLPASYERIQPPPFQSYDRHASPIRHPVIIPIDERRPDNRLPPDHRYPVDRFPIVRPPDKDFWGLNRNSWGSYGGYYGSFGHRNSYYGYGAERNRYRQEENRRNFYIPARVQRPELPNDWGLYGGTYGTGGYSLEYKGYGDKHSYNYWGLDKYHDRNKVTSYDRDLLPPPRRPGGYLPFEKPTLNGDLAPLARPGSYYLPPKPTIHDLDNNILPAEPRKPPVPNFIRNDCSLRSATGFRLHKRIVKKFLSVSNIYECEILCFREKDFPCGSYAYRYTIPADVPADNCFLSNRNYKELDYYTDLKPDRDFDIYTMNNLARCGESFINSDQKDSDCFWRVRSGQRLDHSIVRDSLTVKSIINCQLECLQSKSFTCRAYSFRYGSPVIGGAIDNCQLTDWPFFELDPKIHFTPEPGFEIYERGSYGHGCEPDHFDIRGKQIIKDNGIKVDQLCYIGFGSAAKLLPQATIKSLYVPTELDCKVECSKSREGTLFRCMSFSFTTGSHRLGHNCFLSDIMQTDLLPNIDFVHDPDSWLFAWDNYNPECVNLADKPLHYGLAGKETDHSNRYGYDYGNALDVWRVYSVSGWPCKRGTKCKENRKAGFWYCDLEGSDNSGWDYCCSPDHHCGFSNGYSYSWCFVGPTKTQWRKCNDRYYPYIHNVLDRFDDGADKRPWITSGSLAPPPQTPGYRPDRPNAPPVLPPPRPSLDEYEHQFDNEFLSPPKPGGFGQPRRWPVSYLHKEPPPNSTETDISSRTMKKDKKENSRLSAIKNLINVIQNNDFKHVQYHIVNDSNKPDDILYVKIPLPSLISKTDQNNTEKNNELSSNTRVKFDVVDSVHQQSVREEKALPTTIENGYQGDTKWRTYYHDQDSASSQKQQSNTEKKYVSFDSGQDGEEVDDWSSSSAFEVVDTDKENIGREKSVSFANERKPKESAQRPDLFSRPTPYRRGFVTRTNLTDVRRGYHRRNVQS